MSATRYIWPTSRGWIIGIGSLVWGLISIVNQTLFSYILASFGLALTIISFIAAFLSLRGIRICRAPSDDASVGQIVSIPLEITNEKHRHRQNMSIQEDLGCTPEKTTMTIIPSLKSGESIILERKVPAVRRGEFQLQNLILRGGDPAGLFYRERSFNLPNTLTIYPSYVYLQDLFLNHFETIPAITGQPISITGNSQDFFGVREYNNSDGMRHIHWRSSARYGKLMVKDFEHNAISSVAILLDAQDYFVSDDRMISNLEYLIQTAASITHYCSGMYCSLSLAAGGKNPVIIEPNIASMVQAQIMYQLAILKPGKVSLNSVINDLIPKLPQNSVLFCLSMNDSKILRNTLESCALSNMNVRWCCATKDQFTISSDLSSKAKTKRHSETTSKGFLRIFQVTPEMSIEHALNILYLDENNTAVQN
ncbi:MAG: DUF58 domain-containing protein [Lentisphaeria bacterium]